VYSQPSLPHTHVPRRNTTVVSLVSSTIQAYLIPEIPIVSLTSSPKRCCTSAEGMSQSNSDEAVPSYSIEGLGRAYETGPAPNFQDERYPKPIHSDQTRSIVEFESPDRRNAHRPYTSSLGMVTNVGTADAHQFQRPHFSDTLGSLSSREENAKKDVGTVTSADSLDDDFVSIRSYKSKTSYYTAASRFGDQDPGQKRPQPHLHQSVTSWSKYIKHINGFTETAST
jgi:hypothetical protein